MATTYEEVRLGRTVGATGTIAEAAGSIAVIVLSIIGLAQMTASPTIVAATVNRSGCRLAGGGRGARGGVRPPRGPSRERILRRH